MTVSLVRSAHGAAAAGGALLVVECPPLDEIDGPSNAGPTSNPAALPPRRGRPFQRGNAAAAGRGSSLTRISAPADAPEERRKVYRKATSLKRQRERELATLHGGTLSCAVRTELVAWARNVAWAEHYDRAGDPTKAAQLSEKASGHQLKAVALAEREAAARAAAAGPVDPLAAWRRPEDEEV